MNPEPQIGQLIRRKRDGAIFRIQCIARYAPSTGFVDKALLLNMHGMTEWRSLRYVHSYCHVMADRSSQECPAPVQTP